MFVYRKLLKHRSDVIKRASISESHSSKESVRRRPAPAPPIEKTASVDSASPSKTSNLALVGRSMSVASPQTSEHNPSDRPFSGEKSNQGSHSNRHTSSKQTSKAAQGHSKSKRASTASETVSGSTTRNQGKENVKKSVSVTSSIGQAPSLVSSMSSQSTDLDSQNGTASAGSISNDINDGLQSSCALLLSSLGCSPAVEDERISSTPTVQDEEISPSSSISEAKPNSNSNMECDDSSVSLSGAVVLGDVHSGTKDDTKGDVNDKLSLNTSVSHCEENLPSATTPSSLAEVNDLDYDNCVDDLPPPPPEVYENVAEDDYSDFVLPPAPDVDANGSYGIAPVMQSSVESEMSDQYPTNAMQECTCEDIQPSPSKKDSKFFAR